MLLAIDIGNTQTHVGFFDGSKLLHEWRMTSQSPRTADECGMFISSLLRESGVDPSRIGRVALASVVPALTPEFRAMSERLFGVTALVIDATTDTGIRLDVDEPASVGADRIVNIVGTRERHSLPAIIVDLGTATTFDAVDGEGTYLGGAIAPGIEISAEALFHRGARLARVELKAPDRAIGKTTDEHLQTGIFFGAVGQIDEVVRRIRAEMDGDPIVIATGGLAPPMASHSATIQTVDSDLTLHGIRLIDERVSGGDRA